MSPMQFCGLKFFEACSRIPFCHQPQSRCKSLLATPKRQIISMKIQKVLTLRGPNYWANFPVMEFWVDLEDLRDKASDELPGFTDRLTSWLPTMIEHRCSVGTRGGFFERLRRGTYMAHIMEAC